jgi:(heptosyl)LPS beta-1,4-glucosyltransferase
MPIDAPASNADAGAMNTPDRIALTGVVIALNEADRIGRCVTSLKAVCTRVVVLDSGSTDDTAAIARAAGAEVVEQPWLGFAAQKNAAIARADTSWVLLLDADEWFEPDVIAQLDAFLRSDRIEQADAWQLPRRTIFLGRPLRHGGWGREWLPRLFRQTLRYRPDTVHERLDLDGRRVADLDLRFEHTPVRSLDEHYRKLARYAQLWAEGRAALGRRAGFLDLYTHPLFYLLKNYLFRGGFLDGREGAVFHLAYAGYTHAKYARLWAMTRGPA